MFKSAVSDKGAAADRPHNEGLGGTRWERWRFGQELNEHKIYLATHGPGLEFKRGVHSPGFNAGATRPDTVERRVGLSAPLALKREVEAHARKRKRAARPPAK